jgi:hypothetical protein
MSAKIDGQFVPFPQDLLESPAWWEALQYRYVQSLLNFLLHEHLHHGGKENGNLVAPHRQLGRYCDDGGSIRTRAIRPTIETAKRLGVVRVMPGGHRSGPSRYALTWLPTHDDKKPTRDYLAVAPQTVHEIAEARKDAKRRSTSWSRECAPPGYRKPWHSPGANGSPKRGVDDGANGSPNLSAQMAVQSVGTNGSPIGLFGRANDSPIPRGANGSHYLEPLDQEGRRVEGRGTEVGACSCPPPGEASVLHAAEPSAGDGRKPEAPSRPNPGPAPFSLCGFRVVTPLGDRVCGMLAPAGSDLCVDHALRVRR